jgi:hypothetical protein
VPHPIREASVPAVKSRWTWSDQPSVVIEHDDWRAALEYAAALRQAGFSVLLCAGPDARGASGPCPLLVGSECALVAGADVVVTGLDTRTPPGRDVLAALLLRPRGPAVLALDGASEGGDGETRPGCTVVDASAGPWPLVRAVREATSEPPAAA